MVEPEATEAKKDIQVQVETEMEIDKSIPAPREKETPATWEMMGS